MTLLRSGDFDETPFADPHDAQYLNSHGKVVFHPQGHPVFLSVLDSDCPKPIRNPMRGGFSEERELCALENVIR